LDTNEQSSEKFTEPARSQSGALWTALAMLAVGAAAFLYVLFAAASKPGEPVTGLARFATGPMHALVVRSDPPDMPTRLIRDAAGNQTTLAAMGGDLVIVNLWATWCSPCMEEMPTLGALQRRYDPTRVHVVAVNLDDDADRDKAQAQLAKLTQGSLALYTDSSRGVLFDIDTDGMPVTIFYKNGREIARLAGGADWDSAQAKALVDAALAGP
jgi:thiol-disulfide isomerase/thioredoxin